MSSTALKNANGIEPSSTASRKSTPESTGAGSTRRPIVARKRFVSVSPISNASPRPSRRSTQIVVVSSKPTSSPYSSASVAWMTSFCTSP